MPIFICFCIKGKIRKRSLYVVFFLVANSDVTVVVVHKSKMKVVAGAGTIMRFLLIKLKRGADFLDSVEHDLLNSFDIEIVFR